jgi:hypothetical protein
MDPPPPPDWSELPADISPQPAPTASGPLADKTTYTVPLLDPLIRDRHIIGSSHGWLVSSHRGQNFVVFGWMYQTLFWMKP